MQLSRRLEYTISWRKQGRKRKKANDSKNGVEGESPVVMKEQENLRKKVTDLIKKQKLPAVTKIVKGKDDSKPWNADARAKVGSRLIELLAVTNSLYTASL
uniref:Uncharacterized protein n=1 Tax=Populus trichocarpa TaxID=3694 RepID=A0A3N7FW14_POPTR